MKASAVLRRYFRVISGLPCWGVQSEYGTWLSFEFGEPRLEVKEPIPDSKFLNRRRVFVKGQNNLWLEMGSWKLFQKDSRPIFHSGQTRNQLRRAAAHLNGQILIGIFQGKKPLVTEFKFDHGYCLKVFPHSRAKGDEYLWHFFTQRSVVSLRADGQLNYGLAKQRKRLRCRVEDVQIVV